MVRYRILSLILIVTILCGITPLNPVFAETLDGYNNELHEYYNYPESFLTNSKSFEGIPGTFSMNTDILGRTGTNFYNASYVVYGSDSSISPNNSRTSPITGTIQKQYLGYSVDGTKFDNPAYPWGSWMNQSLPIKNWHFVKKPWGVKDIRDNFKLKSDGGSFSKDAIKSKYGVIDDLSSNMRQGIYEKYIKYTSKDNIVGNVQNTSLYTGETVTNPRTDNAQSGGITKANCKEKKEDGTYWIADPNVIALKADGSPDASGTGTADWTDVVYVLSPPTSTTWGTGWAFIRYSNGTYDYITIPIASYTVVSPTVEITSPLDGSLYKEGSTVPVTASCTYTHHAEGVVTYPNGSIESLDPQDNADDGHGGHISAGMTYSGGNITLPSGASAGATTISVTAHNQEAGGQTATDTATVNVGTITASGEISISPTRVSSTVPRSVSLWVDIYSDAKKNGTVIPITNSWVAYKVQKAGTNVTISDSEVDTGEATTENYSYLSVPNVVGGDVIKCRIKSYSADLTGMKGGDPWDYSPTYEILVGTTAKAMLVTQYIDINGGFIQADKIESNLAYGSYTRTADTISGYTFKGSNQYSYAMDKNSTYLANVSTQTANLTSTRTVKYIGFFYEALPTPIPTPSPTPKPSPTPLPAGNILAVINAPETVKAGQTFTISGAGSSTSYPNLNIDSYVWNLDNSFLNASTGNSIGSKTIWANGNPPNPTGELSVRIDAIGTYRARLTVFDTVHASSQVYKDVTVILPTPDAEITTSGSLKENRIVNLSSAGSKSPELYPISSRYWTISPIPGTGADNSFYIVSDTLVGTFYQSSLLNNVVSPKMVFKKAGQYQVKLEVRNTAGYSDTETKIITIGEDLPPIPNVSVAETLLRNPENNNKALLAAKDLSYTNRDDIDAIGTVTGWYKYDSDNDASYDDEGNWIEFYSGAAGQTTEVDFETGVGSYLIRWTAFDADMVFVQNCVSAADVKYAYIEKETKVDNLPPFASLQAMPESSVNLVFNIGNTANKDVNTLLTKINDFVKPLLSSCNIKSTVTINTGYSYPKPIAAAAGHSSAYVLKDDGTVWSWGANELGQLGNGTTTNSSTPVQVYGRNLDGQIAPLTGVTAISAYQSSIAALKNDGTVVFWGGHSGGNGNGMLHAYPVTYLGIPFTNVKAISTNGELYMIKNDSSIHKFSYGDVLRMWKHIGNTQYYIDNASSVADGRAIVLLSDGTAWNLTNNTGRCDLLPFFTGGEMVTVGSGHTIVLKNGNVWSWGNNCWGQLGYGWASGNPSTSSTIADISMVNNLSNVVGIKAGLTHSFALKSDGTVWAWGYNDNGQLGDGTTTSRYSPVRIQGLTDVKSISGGYTVSLAVKNDGTVWAWGSLVGSNSPVQVSGITNVGTPTVTPLDTVASSINWERKNTNFLIDLQDTARTELPSKTAAVNNILLSGGVSYYGIGTTANKSQIESLGTYISSTKTDGSSNIDIALVALASGIAAKINGSRDPARVYTLINEPVTYTTFYSDDESDSEYAHAWNYSHNADYFENNTLGKIAEDGQDIQNPINSFAKKGQYLLSYKTQDSPKASDAFSSYRKWSNQARMYVYVHEKPVADFDISILRDLNGNFIPNILDKSYDNDHKSSINRGITETRWQWKEQGAPVWTIGQPLGLQANKDYTAKLEVKDLEGVWSDAASKNFSTVNVNYIDVTYKTLNKETWFRNDPTIPAGEEVSLVSATDNLKGVKITASNLLTSAEVYFNGTKLTNLTLNAPTFDGVNYVYYASVYNYRLPATLVDGNYSFTVKAIVNAASFKSIDAQRYGRISG